MGPISRNRGIDAANSSRLPAATSFKNAFHMIALAAPLICGCESTMVIGSGVPKPDAQASADAQADCQTDLASGHKILLTVKNGGTYEMCGYASLSSDEATALLVASKSAGPMEFSFILVSPKAPYIGAYQNPPEDGGISFSGSFSPGDSVQCSDGKTDHIEYAFGSGNAPFNILLQQFPSAGGYAIGIFSGTMKSGMRKECSIQDIDVEGSFDVLVE